MEALPRAMEAQADEEAGESMNDDEIRGTLRGLLAAPVPPAPLRLEPRPEPRAGLLMALAAGAMVAALVVSLLMPSPRAPGRAATGPVASRIDAVEAKIAAVGDVELRRLMEREAELLREELELAR